MQRLIKFHLTGWGDPDFQTITHDPVVPGDKPMLSGHESVRLEHNARRNRVIRRTKKGCQMAAFLSSGGGGGHLKISICH